MFARGLMHLERPSSTQYPVGKLSAKKHRCTCNFLGRLSCLSQEVGEVTAGALQRVCQREVCIQDSFDVEFCKQKCAHIGPS